MIVAPLARLPPTAGVKAKVAVELTLPATRSRAGIEKEEKVTAPPITGVAKYIPNIRTKIIFILFVLMLQLCTFFSFIAG